MTRTTVVNLAQGDRYDMRIDRLSLYGNQFRIGRDGNRATVVDKHMRHWRGLLNDPATRDQAVRCLHYMKGKRLGCHCTPLACHGDNYVTLIAEFCP